MSTRSAVTSFYSRSFLVKSRQQILKPLAQGDPGLKELTVTALEGFKQARHTLPKYVVVYRCVPVAPCTPAYVSQVALPRLGRPGHPKPHPRFLS